MYNPKPKELRSFESDYPQGSISNVAGQPLERDIHGGPLTAPFVAGRRMVGGSDQAVSPEDYDAVSTGLIGKAPEGVPSRGSPLKGNAGLLSIDRRSGPVALYFDRALAKPQAERVVGHELGHAIDEIAGHMPVDGLNDELRTIYNDLNNPQSYGKKFGPEQHKYKGGDIKRELVAEAVRAYMTDPNYMKTVASKTAERLRRFANPNPNINKIIQFNSGGAPGAAIGLGAAQSRADFTPAGETDARRNGLLYF